MAQYARENEARFQPYHEKFEGLVKRQVSFEQGRVLQAFDDNALPPACEAFFRRRHDRPWFLMASLDNPHNICEHSRDQNLPWGDVGTVPLEALPNLPSNFPRPAFEPQVTRVYRQTNIRIEMVNLAVEKRYEEILNEHRRHLADWCGKTGDRFAEDDGKPGRANIPGLRYVDV